MKVLQINSVCGIGSTGRITTDLHRILVENLHESYIAYGRGNPQNCNTSIRIGNVTDNYLHVAKTRLLDRHGFGSLASTRKFIKKVEVIDPDIIHLHNIHGYYINIEILMNYLKEINKPIIWTLHDCWSFTGHCAHFDFINCDKWKNQCTNCPQKSTYPSSLLLDNAKLNYIDKKRLFTGFKNMTIVTPSKWLGRIVENSFLKEYPIKVINNGIDLSIFKPTESDFRKKYSLENKCVILGVAGNWNERKGLNYLLQLSASLNDNYKVVIVGLSNSQLKDMPSNILGIRKTNSSNELAQIYTAADIFVNPTLEDNFPTTNIEALACGVPIISFNTGGSSESIEDGLGYIIEKGNIKELINKINIMTSKPFEKPNKLSIKKAISDFSKEKMYDRYLNLYLSKS